jgi:hypothetical protein
MSRQACFFRVGSLKNKIGLMGLISLIGNTFEFPVDGRQWKSAKYLCHSGELLPVDGCQRKIVGAEEF